MQWAAVRIYLSLIIDPPQRFSNPFRVWYLINAIQGNSNSSATFPPATLSSCDCPQFGGKRLKFLWIDVVVEFSGFLQQTAFFKGILLVKFEIDQAKFPKSKFNNNSICFFPQNLGYYKFFLKIECNSSKYGLEPFCWWTIILYIIFSCHSV